MRPAGKNSPLRRSVVKRKGFALVAVMWVVVIAALMLLGVRKGAHVNLGMAHNELESVRAHWLARAGIEKAIAVLAADDTAVDGAWDYWYSDRISFYQIEMHRGEFSVIAPPSAWDNPRTTRYGVIDHSGRVNLNTADRTQLKSLRDLADWEVDSLLDWRDEDSNALPGGAEAQYYQQLGYPYEIRNGPLQTMGELRLVRGMDANVVDGEDANGNGILDENEDDGIASAPRDDANGQLSPGMSALCTVYSYEQNRDAMGQERVNVNTTDKETLTERFDFSDALADAIISHNASGGESGRGGPSRRFNNLMDLSDVRVQQQSSSGNSDQQNKVDNITLKWLAEHLDELTLTDDDRLVGRINVNTAAREVLLSLPEMTPATTEAILRRQDSGEGPFQGVGELLTDNILTDKQFKAVAEKLTVRSNVFEIRSLGSTSRGVRQEIVVIVDRGTNPISVLYWHQSE